MESIIYTQRVDSVTSYQEKRDAADQRIVDFISACGYLPIPLPNKPQLVEGFLSHIQPIGIILTGGNSIVKYGGNAPERDAMDKKLIEISIQKQIPLYGFCRGMQSILDYFGNDLVDVQGHVAKRHQIIRDGKIDEVNSYHQQACIRLKDTSGLISVAESEDGVIEAVKHKQYPLWGNMWHPEREDPFHKRDMENLKRIMKSRRV
ncbi:MAG: gamma-glutamyl-gamma-aminobutyrate hydrolase family protein [Lachnospiraceae bacterium]|nr:gamma-glutamyl-gamma-aminobutyrate hydrolase family protein [Lachnospiraceae bacterium]